MNKLQIVFPYYDNARMLERHIEVWHQYPAALRERVRVVITDDASQKAPALPILEKNLPPLEVMLFRVLENIRWNQNGARNLAFKHGVNDGWALSTDADHIVTPEQLERFLNLDVNPKYYYTLGRRRVGHEEEVYKRHPNSYLITKELYWAVGGYDEDFAGYYGSDCTFRNILSVNAEKVELELPYLVVYDTDDIPDANTTEFERKQGPFYAPNVPRLALKRRSFRKAENPIRFKWERQL